MHKHGTLTKSSAINLQMDRDLDARSAPSRIGFGELAFMQVSQKRTNFLRQETGSVSLSVCEIARTKNLLRAS